MEKKQEVRWQLASGLLLSVKSADNGAHKRNLPSKEFIADQHYLSHKICEDACFSTGCICAPSR